jgi:hypothetical protein
MLQSCRLNLWGQRAALFVCKAEPGVLDAICGVQPGL